MLFTDRYVQRLVQLLEIDTVTPMESHQASQIAHANAVFADWAASLGMRVVFAGPGEVRAHDDYVTPRTVERLCHAHEDFLDWQPHTVLEIGHGPKHRTLMFNFHMDTVSPICRYVYAKVVYMAVVRWITRGQGWPCWPRLKRCSVHIRRSCGTFVC